MKKLCSALPTYPENLIEMTSEVTTQDVKWNTGSFFKKLKRSSQNKMWL